VSACGFTVSGGAAGGSDDAGQQGSDAGNVGSDGDVTLPDADLVPPMCPWPYTPTYATPCPGQPGTNVVFSGGVWTLDTTFGTLLGPVSASEPPLVKEVSNNQLIVWVGDLTIASNASLVVVGAHPVTFVATGNIEIDGTLSANGSLDEMGNPVPGAGGEPAACMTNMVTGALPGGGCLDQGASGGGGGGFGGGNGGQGGNTTGNNGGCGGALPFISGGAGGVSLGVRPTTLRGGCSGANGATSSLAGGAFGKGGAPGGGISLAARGDLTVNGKVVAGGAGGGPGDHGRSAGGGGGSGGMLTLEASTLHIASTGVVAANGGGGGGGCDMNTASPGQLGPASSSSASGGAKEGGGGNGAKGGGLGNVAASADPANRGGGGGGGAIGWIYLHGTTEDIQGTVAPARSN
jgi:hypothetical protein